MEKKRVLLCALLLFVILMPVIFAADNETDTETETTISVEQLARQCITDRIEEKTCSQLTFEEKVYAVLSTGRCSSELQSSSSASGCWPNTGCDVVSTSKAILALNSVGVSTTSAESWLLTKNITTSNLDWYLQIESTEASTCTINYDDRDYTFQIAEDKKLSSGAGTCLTLSAGDYWLRISESCYNKEFTISCDKSFLTSTFFQKTGSSTIHISDEIQEDSAGGELVESVVSYCFADDGSCDYESSLWAAYALESIDFDLEDFIPYLVANVDSSSGILSEAFLYFLTGDYRNELLSLQKTSGYWDESRDRIFDTSIAISAFGATDERVSKAIEWLEEEQGEDGCWSGIRDTGIVLYFVWPKMFDSGTGTTSKSSCTDAGFYCLPSADCGDTDLLSDYSCAGIRSCCSVGVDLESCSEQDGTLCDYATEMCDGDKLYDYSDFSEDNICCIGECVPRQESGSYECEDYGYTCMSSCGDGYEEVNYECGSYDYCCQEKSGSWFWIILLVILIILVALGIIFREKLQPYFNKIKPYIDKIKSKFSKKSLPSVKTGRPRPIGRGLPSRMNQRTILPPSAQKRPTGPKPTRPKSSSDIDDVLKKLKDMGK